MENKKNREELKKKISEEISKTISSIKKYKDLSQPISPENSIGRISRMDAINNKSVIEAALRQSEDKLQKLKFVKDQIEDKDFGICANCKKEIPIERMFIVPESRYCVNSA